MLSPLKLTINSEYRFEFDGPHFAVVSTQGMRCYKGNVRELGIEWLGGHYNPHATEQLRAFRSLAISWYMRWELCLIISKMH